MIAILINCITLGSYQPCYDARCESNRCQWLKTFDHVIFLFFFMEMLIKMIAMGVSNAPQAYLADYWNRLDAFIVMAGGLEYVLDVGNFNFTAIRTVRVLRPLRAINRIPSMRILVTLLLDTLPMLGNVLLLCFFVFFIFGIIGVQLWSGLLRQRCFISLPGNLTKPSYVPAYYRAPNSDKEYLCSASKDNGLHRCQDLPPLRSSDLTTYCQNSLPPDWTGPPPAPPMREDGLPPWPGQIPEERFIDGELMPYDLVPGDEASPFLVKQLSPLIAQSVFQPAFAPRHIDSLPSMRQRRDLQGKSLANDHEGIVGPLARSSKSDRGSYGREPRFSVSPPEAMKNPPSGEINSTSTVIMNNSPNEVSQNEKGTNKSDTASVRAASLARPRSMAARIRAARLAEKKFLEQKDPLGSARQTSDSLRSPSSLSSTRKRSAEGSNNNGGDPNDSLLVETNANSDQFDSINQQQELVQSSTPAQGKNDKSNSAGRRRKISRKKQKKGSCINWNKYYTNCHAGDTNPFQGTISFDNVGMAWTTIFLVISLEGWSDIMYLLQDSHSFWVWTYFVLLIVIGSFFMINLCLVVIATQFSATKKREMERMRQERLKFSSSSTLTATSESTNCYTVIVKYIAHCLKRSKNLLVDRLKKRKCNRLQRRRLLRERSLEKSSSTARVNTPQPQASAAGRRSSWRGQQQPQSSRAWNISEEPDSTLATLESSGGGDGNDAMSEIPEGQRIRPETLRRSASGKRSIRLDHNKHQAHSIDSHAYNSQSNQQQPFSSSSSGNNNRRHRQQTGPTRTASSNGAKNSTRSNRSLKRLKHPVDCPYCEGEEIDISLCPSFIGKNERLQRFGAKFNSSIKELVDHRYFQRLILLAILINAISMGIEYHNQPAQLTEAVEISNIVFAFLFLIEMILKLIAHGLYDYVIDGFNCFDGCIVIISILELFASTSGGSGLSVLRTFRLLRILKLVRFMPALRRQLVIMLRTLDNVAVFFGLLVLFIFIFAILGMNLFGCKFCETLPDGTERCDRKNFNSLLWSLVTVFQILTQEDWNVVLFNGMEKTSHWAALYFVLLMTFGNYVLFNLLVAILVEGFSQEDDLKVSSSSSYTISNSVAGQGSMGPNGKPAPAGRPGGGGGCRSRGGDSGGQAWPGDTGDDMNQQQRLLQQHQAQMTPGLVAVSRAAVEQHHQQQQKSGNGKQNMVLAMRAHDGRRSQLQQTRCELMVAGAETADEPASRVRALQSDGGSTAARAEEQQSTARRLQAEDTISSNNNKLLRDNNLLPATKVDRDSARGGSREGLQNGPHSGRFRRGDESSSELVGYNSQGTGVPSLHETREGAQYLTDDCRATENVRGLANKLDEGSLNLQPEGRPRVHDESNNNHDHRNHNNASATRNPRMGAPAMAGAHFSMSDSGIGSGGSQLTSCPDQSNLHKRQPDQRQQILSQHQEQFQELASSAADLNNVNVYPIRGGEIEASRGVETTTTNPGHSDGFQGSDIGTSGSKVSSVLNRQSKLATKTGAVLGSKAVSNSLDELSGNLTNASRQAFAGSRAPPQDGLGAVAAAAAADSPSMMDNKQGDKAAADCQARAGVRVGVGATMVTATGRDQARHGAQHSYAGSPTPSNSTTSSSSSSRPQPQHQPRVFDDDDCSYRNRMADRQQEPENSDQLNGRDPESRLESAGEMKRTRHHHRSLSRQVGRTDSASNTDDDCKFMAANNNSGGEPSSMAPASLQVNTQLILLPTDITSRSITPQSETSSSSVGDARGDHAAGRSIIEGDEEDEDSFSIENQQAQTGPSPPAPSSRQARGAKSYWNYGQLVTSCTSQPCLGNSAIQSQQMIQSAPSPAPTQQMDSASQQQQQSVSNYFGLRRPPKRLVYFYDINDDVDEEIAFLAESLETKSYAISMIGQHDHYLENIAKSQAAAARMKARTTSHFGQQQPRSPGTPAQMQCQVNAYKAEQNIKSFELSGGSISGVGCVSGSGGQEKYAQGQRGSSFNLPFPLDEAQQQHHLKQFLPNLKRSSFQAVFSGYSTEHAPTSTAAWAPSSTLTNNKTPTQSAMKAKHQQHAIAPPTIELPLNPHWCSIPSNLNKTSIAMMRCYQTSLASNLFRGRRERALLNERGHFDRACCRVDYDAYARAVDVFMSEDGQPISFNVHEEQAESRRKTGDRSSHRASSGVGGGGDINLGIIYEPFKLSPKDNSSNLDGPGGRNRFFSMSHINQQLKQSFERSDTADQQSPLGEGANSAPTSAVNSRLNPLQRGLLISLEKYALALSRYEIKREQMRLARAQEQAANLFGQGSQSNLNRTTQALRRGSVVVLSKLKLLHSGTGQQQPSSGNVDTQPNTHVDAHVTEEEKQTHERLQNQSNDHHYPTALQANKNNGGGDVGSSDDVGRPLTGAGRLGTQNVPRLSLTKAESLVNGHQLSTTPLGPEAQSGGGSQGMVSATSLSPELTVTGSQLGSRLEAGQPTGMHCSSQSVAQVSDVAIPITASNESLTATSHVDFPTGAGSMHAGELNATSVGAQGVYSRHSIANLPSRGSLGFAADHESQRHQLGRPRDLAVGGHKDTFGGSISGVSATRGRPVSAYASPSGPPGGRLRTSVISDWFMAKRPATAHGAMTFLQHPDARNSCISAASKATSELTEHCTGLLKPNLRRRRSFSGPLEWLERNEHRQNLLIEPSKKSTSKRRIKKMKPQKSNSSDYHSLNNRRVYRLDSRGFQTKLKGTFYVITHDPLVMSQQQQQQQDAMTVASYGYDWAQQALPLQAGQAKQGPIRQSTLDRETMSSNDLESSFFNTSQDDLNTSSQTGCDLRAVSRDTIGRSTARGQQQQRTFLVYFHWTQWMIQRRHYSLFIFSPKSRVRRFCLSITSRKEFDYFVLFFISMNCVTLAMERPRIPPWSKEREFLTLANYYFTFMFTFEMVLKVIAKGLYYGKDAYLSDSWNIMDGTLVGFSLFDVLLSIVADRSPRIFAILRVFRLLRSLRPLRVINRLMGLKLVVQTLLLSLRPIGNIVLICCTFFIIFGILGVQLFKGTFYYCDGPDPLEIMRTVRTKEDCLIDHRNRWINRKYNFDNLGQALMALFVLSSKDGWVNIMYTGLDAVGVDMQPRENYNEWRLLYFISFLLLVAFFVLNMFVGVVVENFHRCRKEQELEEKARRAEKRQRKLDKRRRQLREPPYYANYGKFRLLLHKWVTGGYFDLLIAAVIGFNVVFMSLEHYQMPANLIHLLKVTNYFFTAAFILEAAIKTAALGMRRYLKDRWNQLDVAIVAMSIIGILFEEMDSFTLPINPTLLRVLRVMRIARVLKLLKMAKGIRALLDTVMQALPQVGNLGLLFFLLFFIFAALGVELFGRLECSDEYPCSGLMDQHAHFQNFGLAFLTLFRVATGDNWNGIMKDTLRDKCDPSSNCLRNCCVSQIIAPLYFVVFVLLAQFVLVNVVVAVLMKHLEESHHEMEIDEEYELDKQLAEELNAKKKALLEAKERQTQYWI